MFCYRKITPGRGAHRNRERFSTQKIVSSLHHCSCISPRSSRCCSPPTHRPTDLEQYCLTRWQTDSRGRSPMRQDPWQRQNVVIHSSTRKPSQSFSRWVNSAKAPLHPWEWPERAWSRVHVDYAGPMDGLTFLIVVDAYSKWMEVVPVKSATSQATIEKLRTIFVTHGLPEMLVSDNGSAFASAEFQEFTSRNAIRHEFVSPYNPSSNGLAERAVQSFKSAWRKTSEGSIKTRIAKFLFHQRLTPHTSTGNSPAELLLIGQKTPFTARCCPTRFVQNSTTASRESEGSARPPC